MTTEIRVPQLPESVADATLVAWHKQPGDAIKRDENLADLETDKVVLEVPAPANGVVREIKIQSGTVVTSGQLLAIIEEGATAGASTAERPTGGASGGDKAAAGSPVGAASATAAKTAGPASVSQPGASASAAGAGNGHAGGTVSAEAAGKLSPSVRRLVEENKLDPGAIPASGKDGRLTKSDVVDFLGKKPTPVTDRAEPPASAPAARAPAPAPSAPTARPVAGSRTEQRVPMTRLRQRIAQRLVEAQSTQALLTSFNEVDMTAVMELRNRYKDRFEKDHGVKLGFMSFFVKASIEALKKFPAVNASIDGTDVIYHEYYDIGVAVSTERGLMVPIVRDADVKSFATIEKEIGNYAKKAREGTIAIEDLTGGTFTITNGGVFGSLMSTPIVNAPQSAILGMHKTQERPMVVNGQIVARPMMYLAVTYDHRLIDGREAVQFLVTVKESLEDPGRMLLGV
ncbi:MAG TPA: 2-oxoglutarate dehydrogenase complex dihydrolipoyllysine-residue succinyltransferase [Steroidobacteraceae bacterium]|nr:2-oxoglutarate dehydrogenase complex dihydrolipoyllysine-residue succinyltransferase [Steroidobacteraceae bacterium]